jgi:hypothetical protein
MLYYAFSRRLPAQIIMTRGKEDVMSEKHYRAMYGATCVTSFSAIIESREMPDIEAFSAEV